MTETNNTQTNQPATQHQAKTPFTTDIGAQVTVHSNLEDVTAIQAFLGRHYNWTSTIIPPGGLLLPYELEENFNWALIGARRAEFGDDVKVLYRGEWYTRRVMEAQAPTKKIPNGMPAAIKYSRGAKAHDPEHLVENTQGEIQMVPLITFRGGGETFKKHFLTPPAGQQLTPPSGTPITENTTEITFTTDLGTTLTVTCTLAEVQTLQTQLGQQGWTSAQLTPGGLQLPYELEENFNWALIGARRAEFGDDVKVLYRGEWYTRRVMEAQAPTKKIPNGMPAAIKYSRGAKAHDPEHLVENTQGEIRMVPLVTFRGGGHQYKTHLLTPEARNR